MNNLFSNISTQFYRFHEGTLSLADFEQWLYEKEAAVAAEVSPELHQQLLQFNYRSKYAEAEFHKLFIAPMDWQCYEYWRLYRLLDSIIQKDAFYADSLASVYELYCQGYTFLEQLALGYGLRLVAGFDREITDWQKVPEVDKLRLLGHDYEKVATAAEQVKNWLKKEQIVLTGKRYGELNRLEFEDKR